MKNLFSHIAFSWRALAFGFGLFSAAAAGAALPEYTVASEEQFPAVSPGTATRLIVKSESLGDRMIVDVWFPPTYDAASADSYPVVYVHDGQNLFDPALSFSTVAWELDMTAANLAGAGKIVSPIIVGIHNRGSKNLRPNDYFPEKAVDYIPAAGKDASLIWETCLAGFYGDEHASFVATELKPLIDELYNTLPDRNHTFAMGSSMGALASLYLLCEYPETFGGAACMSTHWIGSFKMNADYSLQDDPVCARAMLDYMAANLPETEEYKLYLDQGTTGWDADYQTYESEARKIAGNRGYNIADGTLMTYDAAGAGHNEWFWQQRAARPLTFLLSNFSDGVTGVEIETAPADSPLYDLSGRQVASAPSPGVYIRGNVKVKIMRY